MKAADSRLSAFLGAWGSTHAEEYEILVPKAGIKLMPPAVEVWSRNHCNTGESPRVKVFNQQVYTAFPYFGETDNTEICKKISSTNSYYDENKTVR